MEADSAHLVQIIIDSEEVMGVEIFETAEAPLGGVAITRSADYFDIMMYIL